MPQTHLCRLSAACAAKQAEALELISDWTHEEREFLRDEVPRRCGMPGLVQPAVLASGAPRVLHSACTACAASCTPVTVPVPATALLLLLTNPSHLPCPPLCSGLRTPFRGGTMQDLAQRVLEISRCASQRLGW